MSGSRIWKAQTCLILFLKILPQDFEFNIMSFGTEYELMWEECQQYSQETLEQAITYVINMDADIRGTEILNVFMTIVFNKNYGKMKNTTLTVFLLTDGEVEADPIIDLVKIIIMLQLEFTLQDLVKNVVNIQSKDWLKWEMINIKLQVIKKTLIQKQLIYWKILQLHIYKGLLQILIQLKQLKSFQILNQQFAQKKLGIYILNSFPRVQESKS